MANFPAFCDNCGTAFNSGINLSGSIRLTIANSKSGPCPACGAMGTIPDGTFNIEEHLITFLSGPVSTYEKLKELQQILEQAKLNNESAEATLKAVESVSPTIATVARTFSPDRILTYLGLVIATVDLVTRIHSPSPLTREDAQALVREAITEIQSKDVSDKKINHNERYSPNWIYEMKTDKGDDQKKPDEPINTIQT